MQVVSLFDGASMGQYALEKAGKRVDKYYASEIDKTAISVAKYNYPNTIQLGNVEFITNQTFGNNKIDLLMGGSPCQGFSYGGKGLNFNDPRSKLFFEFIRLKNELNPKFFFLENVNMRNEWKDLITKHIGVEPIYIDSAMYSAQSRKRLYWTNIPYVHDSNCEKSSLQFDEILDSPGNKGSIVGRRIVNGVRKDLDKSIPISQCIEVRKVNRNKSSCLTTVAKDNIVTTLPIGRHPGAFDTHKMKWRYLTRNELCRLSGLPIDYFGPGISDNQVVKITGNGWQVDTIVQFFKNL